MGPSTYSYTHILADKTFFSGKWIECLESGGQINAIYSDFKKAFYEVPHNYCKN